MKFLPIFLIVIIMIYTLQPKDTPIQPLKQNDTILAFGDSLTYGYNAKPEESYPSILSRLSGYNITNAGVLGDTSAEGLSRLSSALEDDTIKLIILFFGGNDIIQRLSTDTLKTNLKTMIRMAKEKNIDILLVSVPNIGMFGLSPLALYEEVAKEENIPLLNGMMADILEQPSLKSDQIHPNALGYKLMGEKIYEKLQEEGWI